MKLFIDDERVPNYSVDKIARYSEEAIAWIQALGMPSFISFDHDLGFDFETGKLDTAMNVINWIIESWLDNQLDIPTDFAYHVHSQNPVGAANIKAKMDSFLKMARG